ncbi:alpha-L-rhamnosidase [Caldicellulosiruptor hydrothermalis 108]|uniref:alpha-L-rhamnosidase n=1 Tax=Caldicellulosiruptor hydrothermalis (strain DSM 18901 / VKM B-2411 / 108) TaxID=632292 RepID=E4Q7Y4_CALH1|nr:alpha-L-rhamnosidase [Caldicellulosiruptor hydrothermalis]ADQ07902.1 alpha-L-rhamnosidase [Caldicellulosiruptor hydrothermalis 108]
MSIRVEEIRCEYKENPIGIDILRPKFSWKLMSEEYNIYQTAYRILVAKDPKFENVVWDSGKINSNQSVHIEYDGPSLESRTRYYYKIKVWDNKGNESEWSPINFWEMGILDKKEWIAKWISPRENPENPEACPYIRKEFLLKKNIKWARVYVSSLGMYELHLNGLRVGDWYFTPGWTSYHKRIQYQTYDVTSFLRVGKNAIGVILGPGWYKGYLTWEKVKNIYGERLALILQLHIQYEDGDEEIIITDNNWKFAYGPILMSEIYDGEIYDANLEEEGWDLPNFNDNKWENVEEIEYSKEVLIAQESLPVRKIEELKLISLIRTPANQLVIDMGQNMVGWVRFKVSGQKGEKVVLKHAEILDKDGNFYTENLRKAKQTIEYTLKGNEVEIFEPHFTYQGFRYVLVENYPGEVNLENFTGIVIHTDLEITGYFRCSDELINKLQHNIVWGQKGNFVDIPTDCPQRDERLGWTGDAQVFMRTACFNMNVAPFFTKWLHDLKVEQFSNGGMPFVIPDVLYVLPNRENKHSSSGWGDAVVICPWTLYLCYGDKRILEELYENMKAWIEYIRKQGENEYLWNTGFHFGDWLALDASEGSYTGSTPRDLIATAFYAYSTSLLVKSAKVLGKNEDAEKYTKLYSKIVESFRKEFVRPDGQLIADTQTAYVLALMFDLIEEKHKKKAITRLVQLIEENNYHLTTGFLSTPYLCHVLTKYGYVDIAYKLLLQKDYPSWLYQILKGATTIWEHWDGIKEDGSLWDPAMNSFNHYAYGSIGDWLYRVVAGIDTSEEKPGYKHILIKPYPQAFQFVEAQYNSINGLIKVFWENKKNEFYMKVHIPPNTSASIYLPYSEKLDEKEISFTPRSEIREIRKEKEGVVIKTGSGKYEFRYSFKQY